MYRLIITFQYRDMEESETMEIDFDTAIDAERAGTLLAEFICGDDCFMTFKIVIKS